MNFANFDVVDCPNCHGDHSGVYFTYAPGQGPTEGHTHWAECPNEKTRFWMDTSKVFVPFDQKKVEG